MVIIHVDIDDEGIREERKMVEMRRRIIRHLMHDYMHGIAKPMRYRTYTHEGVYCIFDDVVDVMHCVGYTDHR